MNKKHLQLKLTRRNTQIALGIFWLIAGILQLQPDMFTKKFIDLNILSNSLGQPAFIYDPMNFFIHIFLLSPIVFNIIIILIQLTIAFLIFNKKRVKIGLYLSIFWGLFVWYVGEGLGGLFLKGGNATLLMGAPGAAFFYVVLALSVMPRKKDKLYPDYWLIFVWAIVWVGLGISQLLPTNSSLLNMQSMIIQNAHNAPRWISTIDTHVVKFLSYIGNNHKIYKTDSNIQMGGMGTNYISGARGYWLVVILAMLEIVIGLMVFIGRIQRRILLIVGIILSLCFWLIGQSLGQIYSGYASDLNTAPLLILFAFILLGMSHEMDDYLTKIRKRLEEFIA